MNMADRMDQSDSPSLTTGQFHTETGHIRRTPAAKQKYVLEPASVRVRGTPEYNPLYDTFQSDILVPIQQAQNQVSTFSPPSSSSRSAPQQSVDTESNYDRPRVYRSTDKQNSTIQERKSRSNKKVDSQQSEADLLMDKLGGETAPTDEADTCNQRKKRGRRRLLNNIADFLAIVATCLTFGLIYLFVKPVQRGFFCDDTSIQYPFRPDTIPMWLLGIYGGVVPIIIFFIVEFWVVRPFHCRRGPAGNSLRQRQIDYVKTILHTIALFVLGIAVCFLITEVGKRTIGRLRPYYLTVCNPVWSNLNCTKTVTTASGPVVISQYIINHNCNSSASALDLQEAKLSFPSGHSSYSTYAFIFLFVYFEARLVCQNIQFLKPFLQCLCVATAFFTCLSRVTDYKHHATDVIGGALIGFCIAVFTAVRVGTYLWSFSVYCETDEETEKDQLPKEERITVPGVETKQTGEIRSNQGTSSTTRPRNNNRATPENVTVMQPQRNLLPSRTTNAQAVSPVRGYEEANV